jgi:hypothetical protein
MGKVAGTLFALVFAIPFGGVGLGAAYGIGSLVTQSQRAADWVLVQAKVDDIKLTVSRGKGASYRADGVYRYTFEGKPYVSTRLGFQVFDSGGTDNIGDWHQQMVAFMEDARASGKTIPVYVNPDNPTQAVVDRTVRWAMVAFMMVFAVMFGGVGLGALIAIGAIWFSKKKPKGRAGAAPAVKANSAAIASDGGKATIALWLFAFVWNLIAVPMAAIAVPQVVREGQWLGLLVLLFPLVGLLLFWGALKTTLAYRRRGPAMMALEPLNPRMGSRLAGAITFAKPDAPGGEFTVKVMASEWSGTGKSRALAERWSRELKVRAAPDPRGGLRIPFQFDIPGRVDRFSGADSPLVWQVRLIPVQASYGAEDAFPFEMQPSLEPVENLAPPVPTQDELRNRAAMARLFGPQAAAKMTPVQAAALAAMPQDAQAIAAGVARNAGTIRKVVIGIVVLIIVFQVGGALLAFLR